MTSIVDSIRVVISSTSIITNSIVIWLFVIIDIRIIDTIDSTLVVLLVLSLLIDYKFDNYNISNNEP